MPLTTVQAGMLDTTAQYYSFKNRIFNGSMGISQRTAVNTNVAVGTGTAGTFGPDRFSGYTGTGSLWNISQVSTTAYDFPFALRLQRIAGQTSTSAVYLRQIIETVNCKDLAGQTVTLSVYATAGANYSGGAATVQLFTGTAADQGTTSLNTAAWTGLASAINSTFTPTTTRTLFTFTGTLGATTQEVAFSINWSGSGTAGANDLIDITGVQLEKGSTATSFDYRPYGTELALCQRYYARIYDIWCDSAVYTAGGRLSTRVAFPVSTRIIPVITNNNVAAVTCTFQGSNRTNYLGTHLYANSTAASGDVFFVVDNMEINAEL